MNDVHGSSLRSLLRLLVVEEKETSGEKDMGLDLPDVVAPGDEEEDARQKAHGRLLKTREKMAKSLDRLESEKKRKTRGSSLKSRNADAATSFTVAVNNASERRLKKNAQSTIKRLDRSSAKTLRGADAGSALQNIADDPHASDEAEKRMRQASFPKLQDLKRDIAVASQRDDDGEQFDDLRSLVRELVKGEATAVDDVTVAADQQRELQVQRSSADKRKKKQASHVHPETQKA